MIPYDNKLSPPAPCVWIEISDEDLGVQVERFCGIVDSGADRSCIAAGSANSLRPSTVNVMDFNGKVVRMRSVRIVNATIKFFAAWNATAPVLSQAYKDLNLIVVPEEPLVGRDILNFHNCLMAGPRLNFEIQ